MALSDGGFWDEFAYTELDISPLQPEQVQPGSVDLRLGSDFKILKQTGPYGEDVVIDTKEGTPQPMKEVQTDKIIIQPGQCVLGTTMETVKMPDHLIAFCEGRSSVGRHFVEVHQTAGVIDPGYRGEITLEIKNNNPVPVTLYEGQRIAQIVIEKLDKPAQRPYGEKEDSKYQGQTGATESRLHDDR